MLKVRVVALMLVLVLLVSVTGVFAQNQTIVEIAVGNADFSTLVELVSAAGLVDTLSGAGPFTVFAPTNAAFAKLPPVVVDYLTSNPAALTRVLTYHVVAGKVMSADVSTMMAPTVEGGALDIQVTDAGVNINGVNVVAVDIEASNGVIHVVDAVLLPDFELPEVDPLSVSDNIIVAGSSTVFPVTERIADLFNQDGFAGTITVDSIGTGAGFERFCANAETDISNASRSIKGSEADACRANNREPLEFYIGIDALAVAVSAENTFVENLTQAQIADIFSGTAKTWADVDPSWPAQPIQLFSPGTDSGTYDYFVEQIYAKDQAPILNSGAQFSEDDNVLVQGILGSPYAIGYFGYAYFQENQAVMRAVAIDGVAPSARAAETGEYPLSRPLFIYTTATIMAEKPQVAEFVNYYLSNVNDELGTEEGQIGYFKVSKNAFRLNKLTWIAAHGDMM